MAQWLAHALVFISAYLLFSVSATAIKQNRENGFAALVLLVSFIIAVITVFHAITGGA